MPSDFYKMRYYDYKLLERGFDNKRDWEQMLFGKLAEILIQPYTKPGQIITREKLWPTMADLINRKKRLGHVEEHALATLRRFKELEEKQNSKDN